MRLNAKGLPPSAAQWERQRTRDRSGRYSNMTPCYGGCGKGMSVQGSYWSHPLTDMEGTDGVGFGDIGIMLCRKCYDRTEHITTTAEFAADVAAMEAKVAARKAARAAKAAGNLPA